MAAAPTQTRPSRVACTIIAYNEADRIERTILSVVGLVDEIVVVDSGSQDGTVALCEGLGARVIHNPWAGFGPQKRFAEEQASCDWILNLDADEWLSDELRAELADILSRPLPQKRCFRVRILVVYPRRERPAPFAYFHNYVRLYNRATARMRDSLTHDEVAPTDDVVQLKGGVLHRSYRDFAHIVTKTIGYYSLQRQEGIKPSGVGVARLIWEFPFQFFRYYFLRRHIFGGADGFAYAVALSMGRWARIFILKGW
ncbi:MAG: glycosyltransferase family 2 protein [Bradyrhizobium sp.]|nr:MAG: glycosyltransferase family 2 protein [Bradyrhizobium sp.]